MAEGPLAEPELILDITTPRPPCRQSGEPIPPARTGRGPPHDERGPTRRRTASGRSTTSRPKPGRSAWPRRADLEDRAGASEAPRRRSGPSRAISRNSRPGPPFELVAEAEERLLRLPVQRVPDDRHPIPGTGLAEPTGRHARGADAGRKGRVVRPLGGRGPDDQRGQGIMLPCRIQVRLGRGRVARPSEGRPQAEVHGPIGRVGVVGGPEVPDGRLDVAAPEVQLATEERRAPDRRPSASARSRSSSARSPRPSAIRARSACASGSVAGKAARTRRPARPTCRAAGAPRPASAAIGGRPGRPQRPWPGSRNPVPGPSASSASCPNGRGA